MIQQFHSWEYIWKKNENINFSRYMYPHVYSSITYNSQDKEATKVSIKRWVDKEEVIYSYCCCCCLVAKLCLILLQPHSLPGSSVHGISQVRLLKWIAISYSRDLPNPGIESMSPALAGGFFTTEPTEKICDKPRQHIKKQRQSLCQQRSI